MKSGKNGVEAFAHVGTVGQFINQTKILKGSDTAHEIAHANGGNAAVNGAGFVADANQHFMTATVEAGTLKGGNDSGIIGAGSGKKRGFHMTPSMVEKYRAKYEAKGIMGAVK